MGLGAGDAYDAARAVAVGCSFLFLVLVLGFYARTLPPCIAALLGIGLAATPPMLACESACPSEAPYMLLAAISLFAMLKGTANGFARSNGWWIFAAGLAGGCAWCVRNVGVALFVASLLYLASQWPRLRVGHLAGAAGAWLAGWFASAAGWLSGTSAPLARSVRTGCRRGNCRSPGWP